MLIYAVVFINLACLLYTVAVWSGKIQKTLKWGHVIVFLGGLICDTIGTSIMSEIAGSVFRFNFHGVTGLSAIILMLFNAVWATWVMINNHEKLRIGFHKFSIVVWSIWLIPMVSGLVLGATR